MEELQKWALHCAFCSGVFMKKLQMLPPPAAIGPAAAIAGVAAAAVGGTVGAVGASPGTCARAVEPRSSTIHPAITARFPRITGPRRNSRTSPHRLFNAGVLRNLRMESVVGI